MAENWAIMREKDTSAKKAAPSGAYFSHGEGMQSLPPHRYKSQGLGHYRENANILTSATGKKGYIVW